MAEKNLKMLALVVAKDIQSERAQSRAEEGREEEWPESLQSVYPASALVFGGIYQVAGGLVKYEPGKPGKAASLYYFEEGAGFTMPEIPESAGRIELPWREREFVAKERG